MFILLLFISCTRVILIGAYDQVTDQSIQKIQSDVSSLIVKIEKNINNNDAASNKYENFKDDYSTIEGEIESLKIRCSSIPKYDKIIVQVNALDTTIRDFEKAHQLGFTSKQEIETDKQIFETDFKNMITTQNALKSEKN